MEGVVGRLNIPNHPWKQIHAEASIIFYLIIYILRMDHNRFPFFSLDGYGCGKRFLPAAQRSD
jgi:hypothetical protein